MKKKSKSIITLIVLFALLVLFGYTAIFGWGTEKACSGSDIKLGLDLAGGVSITYQVVGEDNPSAEDMSDTIYKLQQRVTQYSTEAQVYQVGNNRIGVEIPGVSDANTILEELGQPGSLEFYDTDGNVVIEGTDVKSATAGTQSDQLGNAEYVVNLELTDDGAEKFATATTTAAVNQDPIYIVYDDEIISAPSVQTAITDGNCVITGMESAEEAENLASTIRIGGLNLQLEELQSQVVGAQLGSDAIQSALKAGVVGFIIVAIFMIVIYLLPGLVAAVALSMYVALVIILLSAFEITLTLPGIAGIILGIGMAVDANIIIFARIREELATGKTVKSATKIGYSKALSAIIDGNVTTLIAAAVLGVEGTGSIKGFAETLALGIILSMFTALVITRFLMHSLNEIGLDKLKLFGVKKERKPIRFIEHRKVFFIISAVVIIIGFVGMGYYHQSTGSALNYSLDFVGGTQTTVEFDQDYTIEEIDSEIVPKIEDITGDANVQVQKVNDSNQVVFKTRTLSVEERVDFDTMLENDYGLDETAITAETISSTISSEMRRDAVVAVLITAICIMIYIWIRFQDMRVGAGAIIALIHDVLVTLTLYAIVRVSVGSTFIACMLTLVGYSINDTIVVFDRIRENMKPYSKSITNDELTFVIDDSITQTLSRSLFTSFTTVVMVASLYVFGVSSIQEFALPLMIGIISGTYSSIGIAATLWYVMRTKLVKKNHTKTGKNKKNKKDKKDKKEVSKA